MRIWSSADQVVFLGHGLVDLDDQVGPAVDLLGGVEDAGAGGLVLLVGETAARPGVPFDQDLDARSDQGVHRPRRQPHPELVHRPATAECR